MKKNILLGGIFAAGGMLLFRSWSNRPKKAEPMQDFEIEKFQGIWYEIARVDNEYDIHKTNVLINYTYQADNTINIVQNSFNIETEKWETVKGIGKFRQRKHVGALKIKFYNNSFEGYNILSVDEDYQYALIVGRNLKYLWILSRDKKAPLPKSVKDKYLKWAELIGYNVSNLNWVSQNLANPYTAQG